MYCLPFGAIGCKWSMCALEAAVAEIGEKATAIPGDVANLSHIDRLYEAVKRHGRKLDVIFANAGVPPFAPF